jgi:hypothetical protein
MHLSLLPSGDIAITEIHPLEASALQSIPTHADPQENQELTKRLYPPVIVDGPDQTHDPMEVAETEADWDEFVVPELKEIFEGAMQHVQENLQHLRPSAPRPERVEEKEASAPDGKISEPSPSADSRLLPTYELIIPRAEVENWYRAMNQARLAMVENTLWIEANGDLHGPFLAQIHYEIYTSFQQWLVEYVMADS